MFKVGQRVKYVSGILSPEVPIGAEGTVIGAALLVKNDYAVDFDGIPPPVGCGPWEVYASSIVPLTDPGADAFMERMRKLGREPVNAVEKVEVTR
jgi:hypothetical protein